MRLGVCYYPEQWPRDRWHTDAAMMAELGLELVRIGEFAWSSFEPSRERFAWEWLDEAIETLAGAGLEVVLGTPTAAPPVWLAEERPDILSVGPDGRPRAYGSRRHTSPSSPAYREESARIVTAMVERYGEHPAVVAWQLDNEPGNHDSARCWSDAAQAAFTRWLAARHGSIEALNTAWGTAFWSGTYRSFEQVRLPVPTVTGHHPSLLLAHLRFASEQATDALAEQRAIVAAGAPGRRIFTNLYLGDVDVDGRAVARPNGLGAVDLYPHGLSGPGEVGFVLDLARGSALGPDAGVQDRGGTGWVTEQQPGPVNWTGDNPAVPEGQVGLWAWQAALHGIECLLWFRWRAARSGQEQHHAALLRHDGTPDLGHAEVERFVRELGAVDRAALQRPPASVALVYDYGDAWLLGILPHVEPGPTHRDLAVAAHTAARRLGLDVDVVPADADLAGYELVLAPALHQVSADRIGRLEAAIDAGATVVLGPRSLVRDEHAVWVEVPTPGGLSERLGARVDHAGNPAGWPRDSAETTLVEIDGARVAAGGWIETLTVTAEDAEVLGRGSGGPLDGAAVVVRRNGVVHLGAASVAAWTAVLAELTGRTPHAEHLEVFERASRQVVIDHRLRTVTGLDGVPDGA
jgi:beta-galactosidase